MRNAVGRRAYRRSDAGLRGARLLVATLALAGAIVATALFVLPAAQAFADDGSVYVVGGAVHPMANNDIRMEAETVQTVCFGRFAEFRADFRFVNSGDSQTLLLGFPFLDYSKQYENRPSLVAFRVWQDGKQLAVSLGTGADQAREGAEVPYYLHEAVFPPGETLITVSYLIGESSAAAPRFTDDAPATLGPWGVCNSYDYWLHSGAGWSGTIGKAVVRFSLADDFAGWAVDVKAEQTRGFEVSAFTPSPESYVKLDDRTYQWIFEDLEPTLRDDITLAFTTDQPRWDDKLSLAWSDPRMTALDGSGRIGNETPLPVGWEAFDGQPKTAWGAPAPGAGAWTKATFGEARTLREIRILPGRNDDLDSFGKYGRPKALRVTFSDGAEAVLQLKDEPSLQRFPVSADTTWVRLDTLATYPGSVSNDSYIAEIDFGSEPAPEFEAFSDLITAAASPTTQPPLESSSTVVTPTTPKTVPTPTATSTVSVVVTTLESRAVGKVGWRTWLAYPVIGVAVIALMSLIFLAKRTRAKGKS